MNNQEVTAKLNNLRVAPRKAMIIIDLIKGKSVSEANSILTLVNRRAALPVQKLLKSAVANAKHNFQMDEKELYIFKATVDQGPKLKRWIARSRGQANEIQKKTSHITVVLREKRKENDRMKSGQNQEINLKIKKENDNSKTNLARKKFPSKPKSKLIKTKKD